MLVTMGLGSLVKAGAQIPRSSADKIAFIWNANSNTEGDKKDSERKETGVLGRNREIIGMMYETTGEKFAGNTAKGLTEVNPQTKNAIAQKKDLDAFLDTISGLTNMIVADTTSVPAKSEEMEKILFGKGFINVKKELLEAVDIKIAKVIVHDISDIGLLGEYNPFTNTITLYYYELDVIPSVWRKMPELDPIITKINTNVTSTLEHELDHFFVEQISILGFTVNQLDQFNVIKEISGLAAELIRYRNNRVVEGKDKNLAEVVEKYAKFIKNNNINTNQVPDQTEIDFILMESTNIFKKRFVSADYIKRIPKLVKQDIDIFNALHMQKMVMSAEDFANYVASVRSPRVKSHGNRSPIGYDRAVMLAFTKSISGTEVSMLEECSAITMDNLLQSVKELVEKKRYEKNFKRQGIDRAEVDALSRRFRQFYKLPEDNRYDRIPTKVYKKIIYRDLGDEDEFTKDSSPAEREESLTEKVASIGYARGVKAVRTSLDAKDKKNQEKWARFHANQCTQSL